MKSRLLYAGVIVAAVAVPATAQAQGGFPGGFVRGANEGYRVAGPVGAVVAAPVGGVIGGVKGFFGIDSAYSAPPPRQRVVRRSSKKPYVQ